VVLVRDYVVHGSTSCVGRIGVPAGGEGPLLANITIVYPPELSKSVGQDRAREIARLQHARM
jgi:hypothetical protein